MKRYFEYTDKCLRIGWPTPSFKDYAAILIQTYYRAYIFRKFILPYLHRQKSVRISTVPDRSELREQHTQACIKIQRWWRSKMVISYYLLLLKWLIITNITESQNISVVSSADFGAFAN
jgi:hypothetical protein